MSDEKQYLFDNPDNLKWLLRIFYALCAGLLLFDFVYHRHVTNEWDALWGFYAFFGFIACVVLVLAEKEMRKLLIRDEDYYDAD